MAIKALLIALRRSWLLVVLLGLVTGLVLIRLQPGAPSRRPGQAQQSPKIQDRRLSPRNSVRLALPKPSSGSTAR